jgi:hypothetical protein
LTTQMNMQWFSIYHPRKCASLNSDTPYRLWIVRSSVVKNMKINCILILTFKLRTFEYQDARCKDNVTNVRVLGH